MGVARVTKGQWVHHQLPPQPESAALPPNDTRPASLTEAAARHRGGSRRVAVKVLRADLAEQTELRERFLRDAEALSAVRHRNVVQVLKFGSLPNGKGVFLMSELLEGETLDQLLSREAPLSPGRALRYCDDILAGLAAAHRAGVVHGDLNPRHVMLAATPQHEPVLKLLDFGPARPVPDSGLPVPLLPEYLCPEAAAGQSPGAAADLYAVGVMLFYMLTGRLPFRSSSPARLRELHRTAPPPLVSSLRSDVPREVDELVSHLLQKAPSARPPSAEVAQEQVRRLLGLVERRQPSSERLEGVMRPSLSVPVAALTVGLALLGAATHLLLGSSLEAAKGVEPVSPAAGAPKVAVHPLSTRELSPATRQALESSFGVTLARVRGAQLAAAPARAPAPPEGAGCELGDECLRELAVRTGALYGLQVELAFDRPTATMQLTAKLVRADNQLVHRLEYRAPLFADPAGELRTARMLLARLLSGLGPSLLAPGGSRPALPAAPARSLGRPPAGAAVGAPSGASAGPAAFGSLPAPLDVG